MKTKHGLTLIEALIVVAIVALVFGLAASPILSFYKQVTYNGNIENVMAVIDEARKSTLSSFKASQYGVHFENDMVVLFRGTSYATTTPDNDVVNLSNMVEILNISLNGGGSDVVFDRLTGETSNYGTITIQLKSSSTTARTITIHGSGLAEIN